MQVMILPLQHCRKKEWPTGETLRRRRVELRSAAAQPTLGRSPRARRRQAIKNVTSEALTEAGGTITHHLPASVERCRLRTDQLSPAITAARFRCLTRSLLKSAVREEANQVRGVAGSSEFDATEVSERARETLSSGHCRQDPLTDGSFNVAWRLPLQARDKTVPEW